MALSAQSKEMAFQQRLAGLYRNTVPIIYAKQLSDLQKTLPVMILDARSPAEYQVSHIPGATFINYDHFSQTDVASIAKDQPVVVYCTVGYRSERIGEKLLAMGFTSVRNLYGGIIGWSNAGLGLVDNARKPTSRVHTWSKEWSEYLSLGIPYFE